MNGRRTLTNVVAGMIVMISSIGAHSATMEWKEEVRLHDGSIVVLNRFYNLGDRPTLDARERAALDETVTFSLPGSGKQIKWATDFSDSVPEPNSLNLLLLDVVNGVPYIATYPAGCIAYNKWKRPNPPYVFFKYESEEWKRIPLAEFPAKLTKSNVIVGRPPSESLKSFYTVAQVEERNHYLPHEYKTILRDPLPQERCPQYSSGPKPPIPIIPGGSPK
ncbi:MAG: hypothetical protein OEL88_16940 [Sterolibacteriaceae bacterium MAG5]|nr:hypothetical protein [Candidatus Nitricoxidireducens bremensis]